jgi:PKD repeat protein
MNVSLKPAVAAILVLATMSVGCSDDPVEPPPPGNAAPVAAIVSPGQDTTVTVGDAVVFAGTSSDADGTVASHAWTFGDGSSAGVEDPGPHTYANAGTVTATYTVTDNLGATSIPASVTITVVESTPPLQGSTWVLTIADFAAKGVSNFLITFDTNNSDVVRIQYTFFGTDYDYDAAAVTGAGAVLGFSVAVNAEWVSNVIEFGGVLTSSEDEVVGAGAWTIIEGANSEIGAGSGTLTKQ